MSWNDLGTGIPEELGVWYAFDPTIIIAPTGNPTYKITCLNVSPGDRFKTFCWMRFRFYDSTNDDFLPTQQFRVYPSPDPLVREIELPRMLLDMGAIVWVPEVEKRAYPNFLGRTNEPSWGLNLQEWRPDGPPPWADPSYRFNY